MSERKIQLDPMAVVNEQRALIDHYENRNLVLANQVQDLTRALERAEAGLTALREQVAKLAPSERPQSSKTVDQKAGKAH